MIFPSGDYGVAGNGGKCIIPRTGAYGTGKKATRFNPAFPASCPYVTSVGATQINKNSSVFDPESACEEVIHSGGGFSNVFPLPPYQKAAVGHYLKYHRPNYSSAHYNNSTMRGIPDVAANGATYLVPIGGDWFGLYGTSASTPVFGAIITLLNHARLAAGKKPVGFLNPTLVSRAIFLASSIVPYLCLCSLSPSQYANPSALNDITSGGNPGCGTAGFKAVSGWDPVTGLVRLKNRLCLLYYL
jgi:tripeptidyl-peptidase-1